MAPYPVRPIEVAAHVDASPEELFAFVSDTRKDRLWCDNVESVDMVAGDSIEVGTRFRFHQHLDRPGGQRIQFDVDVEVIELGENTITWLATDRFQERTISLGVRPDDQGSRITQVTRAVFRRRPALARWVYPRLARRVFTRQFRALADSVRLIRRIWPTPLHCSGAVVTLPWMERPGMDRFESLPERLIREATEAGEFDELPGGGKPIAGAGTVDDELWWVRAWRQRNESRPRLQREPSTSDGSPRSR